MKNQIAKLGITDRLPSEMMPATEEQALKILSSLPLQYYNSLAPKKISDVFESPSCSVAKFRREFGETKVRSLMVYMISDTIQMINVGKSMNDTQIARASDLILDEYYYLKPDDFKLCFNNAIIGKYGKAYDRIDVQIICDWLNQYCNDRANVADDGSMNEHNRVKERRGVNDSILIEK